MTKTEKEKMTELAEYAEEAVDILNHIQNELELLGRVRDASRIGKAKDIADEFAEKINYMK